MGLAAGLRSFCESIEVSLDVSARCAAGLSGGAPCRLCRHGHSASIPPAFAPAALRALLASGGSAQGPSPPRAAWRPSNTAEPAAPDRPSQRPAAMVRARRTRRSLLRQVVRMRAVLDAGCTSVTSRRTVHGYDFRPCYEISTPYLKTGTARLGRGVLACRWVALARAKGRVSEAFVRGRRAGHNSFRSGSAQGVLVSL